MKRHYCDIEGCKNEAYNLEVQICTGWTESSCSSFSSAIKYEPFEIPKISTKDLCNVHFKKWCQKTYYCFLENPYAKSPEYNPELMKKLKKVSVKV